MIAGLRTGRHQLDLLPIVSQVGRCRWLGVLRGTGGMSMYWMLLPLKRYADFDGRSRPLEYWLFTLAFWLVLFVPIGVTAFLGVLSDRGTEPGFSTLGTTLLALMGVTFLALLIPKIAVTVRRLHDSDKSGWLYLIGFIPYIGGLILFVLTVLPGTPGDNQYGPDPLDESENSSSNLENVFR